MNDERCEKCGRVLTQDDIGFYKKMVNRGASSFWCIECVSTYFGLTTEKAHDMIERFRKQGCTLFH